MAAGGKLPNVTLRPGDVTNGLSGRTYTFE